MRSSESISSQSLLRRYRFRWVSCQLDALERCLDYPTLRKALASLPKTLDETYARILANVPDEHKHHTTRILQFLTFSERPLRITEAVDVIAVEIEGVPRFRPKDRMPIPGEILKCCSSLVTLVTKEDQRSGKTWKEIQLAHFSVKEYITSTRLAANASSDTEKTLTRASIAVNLEETVARSSIAQVCLAYLLELDQDLSAEEIRQSFYLAQYSAQYWSRNTRVAESYSKTVCMFTAELFSDKSSYKTCYRLYNPEEPWNDQPDERRKLAPALYYASLEGLYYSVRTLLHQGADVNAQGGYYDNALQAASSEGYEHFVQVLLDNGADVNAQGGHYSNALQAASIKRYEKVVQMLLKNGADVNVQSRHYGNALYAASTEGHKEVVQILLENSADVNARGNYHNQNIYQDEKDATPLYAASLRGYKKIVQMLLNKDADVNAQGGHYGNAFQAASSKGYEKVVQMLLNKGADVNLQGGRYGNALQAPSAGGHKSGFRLLRGNGV